MRTHLVHQQVTTRQHNQMVEVTEQLNKLVAAERVREGILIVYCPHTTAGVAINENADPDVQHDVLLKLSAMIPKNEGGYTHAEGNSDSHVKSILVGNSVTVLVEDGRLLLGTWQGVYFMEFDGPRQRELRVKLMDFDPAG